VGFKVELWTKILYFRINKVAFLQIAEKFVNIFGKIRQFVLHSKKPKKTSQKQGGNNTDFMLVGMREMFQKEKSDHKLLYKPP